MFLHAHSKLRADDVQYNSRHNMPRRHKIGVEVLLHPFFNLGARWWWQIKNASAVLPPGKAPVPTVQDAGWATGYGRSRLHRGSNLDRLARKESLYAQVLFLIRSFTYMRTANWDMISGFSCDVDEVCALLGHYAAWTSNPLPKFRDKLWVPSSRIMKSKQKRRLPDHKERNETLCLIRCLTFFD
jgi:hypothetical protein